MVKSAVAFMLALGLSLPALAAGSRLVAPSPQVAKLTPIKVDPALLEFIGTWQTSDGELVDPMMFAHIDILQLEALRMQMHGYSQSAADTAGKAPADESPSEAGRHS